MKNKTGYRRPSKVEPEIEYRNEAWRKSDQRIFRVNEKWWKMVEILLLLILSRMLINKDFEKSGTMKLKSRGRSS